MSGCGRILFGTALAIALSSSFAHAQQPNDDRCKATETDRQTEGSQAGNGQAAPAPDSNPSEKLSDCGGVLKPPTVGDGAMEKPAPKVGRTPVIKPDDTQKKQQNDQSPGK
ncbi:MAG: hypothetical protein QM684_00820 [Rhizobium sp.]